MLELEYLIFLGKVPEHKLLVADARTLVITAIVQRKTAIADCDFLINIFHALCKLLLGTAIYMIYIIISYHVTVFPSTNFFSLPCVLAIIQSVRRLAVR